MQLIPKLWLVLCFTGTTLFTPLRAQNLSDEQKIKQTVSDFFQALSDADSIKFKNQCKPDFFILENGEIQLLDTLKMLVKSMVGSGVKRINTLNFKRIVIRRDVAWVTYLNRADFTKGDVRSTVDWLESAVLTRSSGSWKLAMLHSTKLPKKK